MTGMKRLISVGVASVAIATGTLIVSSPAHAEVSDECRTAYSNLKGSEAVARMYDFFLLDRPVGLNVLIELDMADFIAYC
jgi:hypothetical protein